MDDDIDIEPLGSFDDDHDDEEGPGTGAGAGTGTAPPAVSLELLRRLLQLQTPERRPAGWAADMAGSSFSGFEAAEDISGFFGRELMTGEMGEMETGAMPTPGGDPGAVQFEEEEVEEEDDDEEAAEYEDVASDGEGGEEEEEEEEDDKPDLTLLKDIGSLATWSVSSFKQGFGVDKLTDGTVETYWQ